MQKSWLCFIINIIGFQIGWFTCVLGAANEIFWLGPIVVAGLLVLHFCLHKKWCADLSLFTLCIFIGVGFDSLLIWQGIYEPKRWWLPHPWTTVWLAAMWVNFAMTLNVSLQRLQRFLIGAAMLGGIAGCLAYYGGDKFEAMQIAEPLIKNLLLIGLGWAIVTPGLFYLARIIYNKPVQINKKDKTG